MNFRLATAVAVVCLISGTIVPIVCGQELRSTDQRQGLHDAKPAKWALAGATIVTAPGQILEQGTILIENERIVAVGADIAVPPDARTIDLAGKRIYPGLIDGWTEQSISTTAIRRQFPYWNSQVRPQLRAADQFKIDKSYNESLRKQGFVARLVVPQGGVISGAGAFVLNRDDSRQRAMLNDNPVQQILLTVPQRRETYPKSPMGAVALARQAMYDAQWYQAATAAYATNSALPRPEPNDALQALVEMQNSQIPLLATTTNEQQFLRADRFAREFDLPILLRGSGNEYRRIEQIAATGRGVILPVNFPKPPNVGTLEASLDVTLETLMHWDHAPENPARVAQAGLPLAFSSTGLEKSDIFLKQIRIAVSRGLSQQDALRALTMTPASLFGVDDQLGEIAVGKLACLTVTDGELFDEDTKISETWVAGERFEIKSEPKLPLVGQYNVTLDDVLSPYQLKLDHDAEQGKWTGKLKQADVEPVALDRVVLNGSILSGQYEPDTGEPVGAWRWSAVFDAAGETALGQVVAPDGTSQTLKLTRIESKPSPDDTGDNSSEDESKKSESASDDEQRPELTEAEKLAQARASFPVNYPLGGFGVVEQPAAPQPILFRNATIWTCGPAGILNHADLLINDGKIVAVGENFAVPADALIIDANGMHITPGIIDCHSHMATDGGINESGQAITAEVRIGDFVDCDDITIYRQLAGGVTTSNILHGSANPIGGQNQVIKLRWGAGDEQLKFAQAPQGVKFALGENVKQSNWGDDHTTRYPQTRMGVEQLFVDTLRAAQQYQAQWQRWEDNPVGLPPRRDLELDAIVEILEGERWIHCHSYRQDEILALIRVLDQFEIQIGSFQHILEGYKVADEMAEHGAMGSAFADWWAYKFEVYDAIPHAGALMHRRGVVVSFNSDDRELGRHLNHEAAKAVKYGGVPAQEALKFVTLNPARQLRIEQYVGSLERGKQADVVLWSGPPLSTMSRCEQTWVDGIKYFDRAESVQAAQKNLTMRNALIQKILRSGKAMADEDADDPDPEKLWPHADLFCHGHDHDGHDHGGHQHEGHGHE